MAKAATKNYQVTFFKRDGGNLDGYLDKAEVEAKNGFFSACATPELDGLVMVSIDNVAHVVITPAPTAE